MTTQNNLNSYYSHQALKKENRNSSFITRGPAQGAHSHARLWETSPAGARLGQVGLPWGAGPLAGTARAGGARGPWQPGRKEAPLLCWDSQGVGARLSSEGRATRSFPAPAVWTQLKMALGLMRVERSRTCSPQQTKPDIPPTRTEENSEVGFWLFFFLI